MCSDAPDTSGMNRAAEANAEIAKEALAWYKQAYADQAPLREQAAARADEVALAQLDSMRSQKELAERYDKYRQSVFEPLERDIVADAKNFDTEAERERLAGLALGDVQQSFTAAQEQGERNMTRMGENTNDGKFDAAGKLASTSLALASADAKNKSRMQAMTIADAKKADAAALGRGLPSNQATAAGLALNAGNSAVGNAQVPVSLAQGATQMAGQGYQTAIQGNQSSGNLYGQAAQIQSSSNDSGWMSGLANLGMAGAKLWSLSDKNEKRAKKPVKTKIALAVARTLPVQRWKYRDDSIAADGGQEHIGPMAQDVHAALGDEAAPGGRAVDVGTIAGLSLAAVQELDRKHEQLAKKVAGHSKSKHKGRKARSA